MRIGIVGGGIMGLALGYYLQKQGHHITIFERNSYLGGLACSYDYGDFVWDKFYHVILPQDTHLLELLRAIGLEQELRWRTTGTGYYTQGEFYPMSTSLDLLRFPVLGWSDKLRMGLATLYTTRFVDPEKLYGITARDWLIKVFGRSTYLNFWRPLLRAKFGEHAEQVAAVFIWASLTRLMGARSGAAHKESMAYVRGGYDRILATLKHCLELRGARVVLKANISHIRLNQHAEVFAASACEAADAADDFGVEPDASGAMQNADRCGIELSATGKVHWFDHVIFTGPTSHVLPILSDELRRPVEWDSRTQRRPSTYLGVVCINVVLKKALAPYYVLNIADERIPLTGMIEMTSLIDAAEETNGLSLVYIPRYVGSHDPVLDEDDAVVFDKMCENGLKRLFPDLASDEIVSWHVQRARYVQPLPLVGESSAQDSDAQPGRSGAFSLVNTSLLRCATLNNNEVVALAKEFASRFRREGLEKWNPQNI